MVQAVSPARPGRNRFPPYWDRAPGPARDIHFADMEAWSEHEEAMCMVWHRPSLRLVSR